MGFALGLGVWLGLGRGLRLGLELGLGLGVGLGLGLGLGLGPVAQPCSCERWAVGAWCWVGRGPRRSLSRSARPGQG